MPAGHFDKRVRIERADQSRDDIGGVDRDWQLVAKRWAAISDLSGNELIQAQQVTPEITARILLRERFDGLLPTDRIVYGARVFNIGAVTGGSDRVTDRGQELLCVEVVPVV